MIASATKSFTWKDHLAIPMSAIVCLPSLGHWKGRHDSFWTTTVHEDSPDRHLSRTWKPFSIGDGIISCRKTEQCRRSVYGSSGSSSRKPSDSITCTIQQDADVFTCDVCRQKTVINFSMTQGNEDGWNNNISKSENNKQTQTKSTNPFPGARSVNKYTLSV